MLVTIATAIKIAAASFVLAGVTPHEEHVKYFEGAGLGITVGAALASGGVAPAVNGVVGGIVAFGHITK